MNLLGQKKIETFSSLVGRNNDFEKFIIMHLLGYGFVFCEPRLFLFVVFFK